ncbi:uncharacterized protein PgNI_09347, partial [Pyricularia grisea]|uniref:Uncharacterized protein n=1 Tax=Pyricularia grisea TaxID=148305 RepID=A0A6P8ASG3_PYRGI
DLVRGVIVRHTPHEVELGAFDGLRVEKVVAHVLDPRRVHGLGHDLGEILEDDPTRDVGVFFLELGTLVADAAAHVDIQGPLWVQVCRLPDLLSNRIDGQPGQIRLAAQSHELVEQLELLLVLGLSHPLERGQLGLVRVVEDGV